MGQKTNPISNRIGITRGWDSNWCGGNYAEKIAEDYKIREYLGNRLAKASLSKIVIERTLKLITVTIYAARPGFIIGKGGTEVDKLKEELKKVTSKDQHHEGWCRGHQDSDRRPRGRRRNGSQRDVQRGSYPSAHLPRRHRLRPCSGQHQSRYPRYQGVDLQR